jgi:hypothetical protein
LLFRSFFSGEGSSASSPLLAPSLSPSSSEVELVEEDSSTVKAAGGFETLFFRVAEDDSATAATMLTTLSFVYGVMREIGDSDCDDDDEVCIK